MGNVSISLAAPTVQKHAEAMRLFNKGYCTADEAERAKELLQEALGLGDSATVGYDLAHINFRYGFSNEEDLKDAALLFSDLAEDGDAKSAYFYGQMIEAGWGGQVEDIEKAAKFYRQAADAGYSPAMYRLADGISKGVIPKVGNDETSQEWYTRCYEALNEEPKENVDAESKFVRGLLLFYGSGTPNPDNIKAAMEHLKAAANDAHPLAQFFIAGLYGGGMASADVPDDPALQRKWMESAARLGHPGAQEWLEKNP